MRSRPARLTLSALAWIALGAAAFFTFDIQQQIDTRRSALRAFESTARDATDALDDAQAGETKLRLELAALEQDLKGKEAMCKPPEPKVAALPPPPGTTHRAPPAGLAPA